MSAVNSTFSIILVAGVMSGAAVFDTAWSQPPGTVESHQKISDTQGNFTGKIDDSDEFGGAVASLGDLDGPGPSVAALAVGAIGDDDGGFSRGAVYVLFLDATGTVLSSQKISNTQGNFTATLDDLDEFGSSVAWLGDLDGGGPSVAALAVGAVGDDDGGFNRGAVYILFLSNAGTVLSHQKISDLVGGFTAQIDNADEFGGALGNLGNLDGAGPSPGALAVGVIGDDDGGINRGAVYVLFLNSVGSVLSHQKISDTEGNFPAPLDNADEFGGTVTCLEDLDGAGPSVVALMAGAIGDDDGGTDRGAAYVLFLNASGSVLTYQKISNTQGGFTGTLQDLDEFGSAVAWLGDLNGSDPGATAVAVGVIGDDDVGLNLGAVYVLFLNTSGSVSSHQKLNGASIGGALDNEDEFGGALASLGDIDGTIETGQTLVSGASFDDDGGTDRGACYVLFVRGDRIVPVLVSLLAAARVEGGVEIRWQMSSEEEPAEAWLERASEERGPWTRVAVERRREGSVIIDLDREARADQAYSYRLVWTSASGERHVSASLEVGAAGWAVDFGLLPIGSNPAGNPVLVAFTLPQRARVSLDVYDLLGRKVSRLAEGVLERGLHQASWSPRAVSAGVYFVRYRYPGGQKVRRIALRR